MTSGPYALYRYFDTGGILLYVGISGDLSVREQVHNAKSRWMQLAVSSTIERHEDLGEIRKIEQATIETEHPLFNVQHNDTPEARERLRAHLGRIGRLDLLSPARSRITSSGQAASPPHGYQLALSLPPDRIASGPYRIAVQHGSGVTLWISAEGLSCAVQLDSAAALDLAEALKCHATEDAWEGIFSRTSS